MSLRRYLLILLFLVGQLAALTHAIGHVDELDRGTHPETTCDLCLGFHAMGAAAVGGALAPLSAGPAERPPSLAPAAPRRVSRTGYRSRAPPLA